ncbi:MAG: SDR family NAD(P)-dependent oxidoreductase [Chloroflexota bacterium]
MDRENRNPNRSERVALVTGAGRGIGRAIALKLAARGMRLVVHANRSRAGLAQTVDEASRVGVEAVPVVADLSDLDQVGGLVDRALAAFNRLDLLVNNAGLYSSTPLDAVTPELWDMTFAVNLRAVFFLCQAAAAPLRASGRGAIVNLASGGGLSARPGFPISAPYAASKAGVVMLTRVLALALAPAVRVNAVAPGVIASKPRPMAVSAIEKFASITPMRSVGQPGDVADAVCFLASDDARFITGQILSVDGGLVMS